MWYQRHKSVKPPLYFETLSQIKKLVFQLSDLVPFDTETSYAHCWKAATAKIPKLFFSRAQIAQKLIVL